MIDHIEDARERRARYRSLAGIESTPWFDDKPAGGALEVPNLKEAEQIGAAEAFGIGATQAVSDSVLGVVATFLDEDEAIEAIEDNIAEEMERTGGRKMNILSHVTNFAGSLSPYLAATVGGAAVGTAVGGVAAPITGTMGAAGANIFLGSSMTAGSSLKEAYRNKYEELVRLSEEQKAKDPTFSYDPMQLKRDAYQAAKWVHRGGAVLGAAEGLIPLGLGKTLKALPGTGKFATKWLTKLDSIEQSGGLAKRMAVTGFEETGQEIIQKAGVDTLQVANEINPYLTKDENGQVRMKTASEIAADYAATGALGFAGGVALRGGMEAIQKGGSAISEKAYESRRVGAQEDYAKEQEAKRPQQVPTEVKTDEQGQELLSDADKAEYFGEQQQENVEPLKIDELGATRTEADEIADAQEAKKLAPEIATEERQKQDAIVAKSLEQESGRVVPFEEYDAEAKDPNINKYRQKYKKELDSLSKLFKRRIVLVDGGGGIDGTFKGDTVYLNTGVDEAYVQRPTNVVFGHELLHSLRKNDQKAYDDVISVVDKVIPKDELDRIIKRLDESMGYGDEFRGKGLSEEQTRDAIKEEALGNYLGNQFGEIKFWRRMSDKKQGIVSKFMDTAVKYSRDVFDSLDGKDRGTYDDAFKSNIKDLDKALKTAIDYDLSKETEKETTENLEQKARERVKAKRIEEFEAENEALAKEFEAEEKAKQEEIELKKSIKEAKRDAYLKKKPEIERQKFKQERTEQDRKNRLKNIRVKAEDAKKDANIAVSKAEALVNENVLDKGRVDTLKKAKDVAGKISQIKARIDNMKPEEVSRAEMDLKDLQKEQDELSNLNRNLSKTRGRDIRKSATQIGKGLKEIRAKAKADVVSKKRKEAIEFRKSQREKRKEVAIKGKALGQIKTEAKKRVQDNKKYKERVSKIENLVNEAQNDPLVKEATARRKAIDEKRKEDEFLESKAADRIRAELGIQNDHRMLKSKLKSLKEKRENLVTELKDYIDDFESYITDENYEPASVDENESVVALDNEIFKIEKSIADTEQLAEDLFIPLEEAEKTATPKAEKTATQTQEQEEEREPAREVRSTLKNIRLRKEDSELASSISDEINKLESEKLKKGRDAIVALREDPDFNSDKAEKEIKSIESKIESLKKKRYNISRKWGYDFENKKPIKPAKGREDIARDANLDLGIIDEEQAFDEDLELIPEGFDSIENVVLNEGGLLSPSQIKKRDKEGERVTGELRQLWENTKKSKIWKTTGRTLDSMAEHLAYHEGFKGLDYGDLAIMLEESISGAKKHIISEDPYDINFDADVYGVSDPNQRIKFSRSKKRDTEYLKAVDSGDMDTAQKMVDEAAKEAGYTATGFHGKRGDIPNVFEPSNSGRNTSGLESRPATFFAVDESVAEMFASAYDDIAGEPNVFRAYLKLGNSVEKFSTDDTVETLKTAGISSTILKDIESGKIIEYAVFDSNQIKSADPVVKDDQGNIIPLSQRFDTTKDDIRFSRSKKKDAEYLKAVDSGDMDTAQKMVLKRAEEVGVPILDDSMATAYKVRRSAAPKKTQKAYKLFKTKKSQKGEIFPLFVGANDPVPTGVWLDAIAGPEASPTKTGNRKVKSKLGPLSYRPGWHAGDIPLATHIGAKQSTKGEVIGRKSDEVWAEVEMAADVDYQPQANANGTNENGTFVSVNADIKEMPTDGMYRYKTNPNMTGQWIISGSMKVNRILTEREVNDILISNDQKPMPWFDKQKGEWSKIELDLDRLGLSDNPAVNQKKLLDPVTYDDNGNIIPLSERFDSTKDDIRFSRAKKKPEGARPIDKAAIDMIRNLTGKADLDMWHVEVGDIEESQQGSAISVQKMLKDIWNQDVTFFDSNLNQTDSNRYSVFNHHAHNAKQIYVNVRDVDMQNSIYAAVGKNLFERMRNERPELYDSLRNAVEGLIKDTGEKGGALKDKTIGDMLSKISGENWLSTGFWKKLKDRMPDSSFNPLIREATKQAGLYTQAIGDWEARNYISEKSKVSQNTAIYRIQTALADAYADYAIEQRLTEQMFTKKKIQPSSAEKAAVQRAIEGRRVIAEMQGIKIHKDDAELMQILNPYSEDMENAVEKFTKSKIGNWTYVESKHNRADKIANMFIDHFKGDTLKAYKAFLRLKLIHGINEDQISHSVGMALSGHLLVRAMDYKKQIKAKGVNATDSEKRLANQLVEMASRDANDPKIGTKAMTSAAGKNLESQKHFLEIIGDYARVPSLKNIYGERVNQVIATIGANRVAKNFIMENEKIFNMVFDDLDVVTALKEAADKNLAKHGVDIDGLYDDFEYANGIDPLTQVVSHLETNEAYAALPNKIKVRHEASMATAIKRVVAKRIKVERGQIVEDILERRIKTASRAKKIGDDPNQEKMEDILSQTETKDTRREMARKALPENLRKIFDAANEVLDALEKGQDLETDALTKFHHLIAKRYGVKTHLNDDDLKGKMGQVEELMHKLSNFPSGVMRNRLEIEQVKIVKSMSNMSKQDFAQDWWFASVLSGVQTTFDNMMNFQRIMVDAALKAGNVALKNKSMKDALDILTAGIKPYVDAAELKTVRRLFKGDRYFNIKLNADERHVRIYNNLDAIWDKRNENKLAGYTAGLLSKVSTGLEAIDHINATASYEISKQFYAKMRGEELGDYSKENVAANEAIVLEQLRSEGFGDEYINDKEFVRRMALERIDSSNPDVAHDAREMAMEETFSNTPYGLFGFAYNGLNQMENLANQQFGGLKVGTFGKMATGLSFMRFGSNWFNESMNWVPVVGAFRNFHIQSIKKQYKKYGVKNYEEWKKAYDVDPDTLGKSDFQRSLKNIAIGSASKAFNYDQITDERLRLMWTKQALGALGTAMLGMVFLTSFGLFDDEEDDNKFRKIDITGSMKSQTFEKGKFLKNTMGEEPYSLIIRGKDKTYTISYKNSPISTLFGIIGELRDMERFNKTSPNNIIDMSSALASAGLYMVKDKAALSQLARVTGLLNPNIYNADEVQLNQIAKAATGYVRGAIPNFLRDVETIVGSMTDNKYGDDRFYKPVSTGDLIMNQIPFLRLVSNDMVGIKPEKDIVGNETRSERFPWSRWYSSKKDDNVTNVIKNSISGGYIPLPPRSMTMRVPTRKGVYELTADVNERKYSQIFDHYYELAAFKLRGGMEKNLEYLESLPPEQAAHVLQKMVRKSRSLARKETLYKFRKDIVEFGEVQ